MSKYTRWSALKNKFQFKLFFIFTLLTFIVVITLNFLYILSEINLSRHHATELLQLRTKNLADTVQLPLYAENSNILREMAQNAAHAPEIRAVLIRSSDGRLLADFRKPDPSGVTEVISNSISVYSSNLSKSVESTLVGSNDVTDRLIGSVTLERGTADLSHSIRKIVLVSVTVSTLFWLTVSFFSYKVLKRLTSSYSALVTGIDIMRNGDLSFRIETTNDDEPSKAARAVNNLVNTLQSRSEENLRLQEEHLSIERQMLHAQKLESLGIMASGIAHDFNNLLQSILGNMELASREMAPNVKAQKYISNSIISGKHAANLAAMMLTYAGKGFIVKKELHLNELVRENAEILQSAASAAVKIELSLYAELPYIIADEAQIQQLVMNMITNAAESIETQSGLIRITTGVQLYDQTLLATSLLNDKPTPGRYVFLEVADNGCGMTKETLKRLFDPFFTTKFTGRGLGMSAVMGIMKTHGGALFVESQPGRGSTFKALFPVSKPAALDTSESQLPETKSLPEKSDIPQKPLSGLALVVDDEKHVLKVCTKMVKLCGLEVITACDGIDAVSKFREHMHEIDVVLMDLTMPNMDGITAMSEIYSIRPNAKVILASGFNDEDLSRRITGQPPGGFIRKPYNMDLLEEALQSVMQRD